MRSLCLAPSPSPSPFPSPTPRSRALSLALFPSLSLAVKVYAHLAKSGLFLLKPCKADKIQERGTDIFWEVIYSWRRPRLHLRPPPPARNARRREERLTHAHLTLQRSWPRQRTPCVVCDRRSANTAREMPFRTVNQDIDEALPRSNVLTRSGSRLRPVT